MLRDVPWKPRNKVSQPVLVHAVSAVLDALSPDLRAMLAREGGQELVHVELLDVYQPGDEPDPVLVGLRIRREALVELEPALRPVDASVWHLVSTDGPETTVAALGGQGDPIHEINANRHVDLHRPAKVERYLDFFTSFISAERGTFGIVQHASEVDWPEWPSGQTPAFLELLELEEETFFSARERDELARNLSTPDGGLDAPGLLAKLERRVGEVIADFVPVREPTHSDPRRFGTQVAPWLEPSDDRAYRVGLVCYGPDLFGAVFEVTKSGMVSMVTDTQVIGPLPIGGLRFESKFGDASFSPAILIKHEPPEDPAQQSMWKRLAPARLGAMPEPPRPGGETDDAALRELLIQRCYATQRVEVPEALGRPLRFRDVTFFDDVVLDQVTSERSILFEDCTFMGRVLAENLTVRGKLAFSRCAFRALQKVQGATKKRWVALDLEGATIVKDLVIERCQIDGVVSLRAARVGGRGQILSTRIKPPTKVRNGELYVADMGDDQRHTPRPAGLDLRASTYEVGLDIGQSIRRERGADFLDPQVATTIVGPLRGSNLKCKGPVCLFGLVTAPFNPKVLADKQLYLGSRDWYSVDFGRAQLESNLQVWRAADRTQDPWYAAESVITGHLDLRDAYVRGNLDLRGIWVEGDLQLSRGSYGSVWLSDLGGAAGRLDHSFLAEVLDEPMIDAPGELVIKRPGLPAHLWRNGRSFVRGRLTLDGATIRGDLEFPGLDVRETIRGVGTRIHGRVTAGVYVEPVDLDPSWPRPMYEAACEASLDLASFEDGSPQREHLRDSQESCRFIELTVPGADPRSERRVGLHFTTTSASGIVFRDVDIGGSIQFAGSVLEDGFTLENARVKGRVSFADGNCRRLIEELKRNHSFERTRSLLGGDQRWPEEELGLALRAKLDASLAETKLSEASAMAVRTRGEVSIVNCSIGGVLDLAGLDVPRGCIRVLDVEVNGDLRAAGTPNWHEPAHATPLVTRAASVRLEMVRCDGRLHLTGLKVDGDLVGHNLKVVGEAELWETRRKAVPPDEEMTQLAMPVPGRRKRARPVDTEVVHAKVRGCVDIDGSEFSVLRVSGVCLDGEDAAMAIRRSRVGILEIAQEVPDHIDLGSSRVDHWRLPAPEMVNVQRLLRGLRPYAADIHASVERWLRDQGRRDDADSVYQKAMWRGIRSRVAEELGFVIAWRTSWAERFNILWHFLLRIPGRLFGVVAYGALTGWGVGWGRLMVFSAALLAFAFVLVAEPSNRAEPEDDVACVTPWAPGFSAAVPVVTLLDDVESPALRRDGDTRLAWKCVLPIPDLELPTTTIPGVAPHDAKIAVNVLGWLLWPLLILSFSSYLRRGE